MRKLKHRRRPVSAYVIVLSTVGLLNACASSGHSNHSHSESKLLGVHFATGGETARGFRILVFDNGAVEYQAPDFRVSRSRLSDEDLRKLAAIVSDSALSTALAAFQDSSGKVCCSDPELLLNLGSEEHRFHLGLRATARQPQPIAKFLVLINELAGKLFRKKYSLPIPVG